MGAERERRMNGDLRPRVLGVVAFGGAVVGAAADANAGRSCVTPLQLAPSPKRRLAEAI